jgi:trigger factor
MVSDEELAEIKTKHFSFEVRKINRVAKMAVDQALFDAAYGPGQVTSESDFRDKVGSDIEGHLHNQAQKLYRARAIRSIIDATDIELPHDFMRKWLLATREQVNEENVDKLYDTFLRSYKWRLIVEQMQQENEQVKVTQENVLERAKAMVKSQFGAMMGELGEDKLDSFAQYYLKDEKMVQRLFDEELEDRVFFHIQAMKTPAEEEVTGTEFIDILKKENAAKD